ncbi:MULTISPECIES: carbohydrate ABC transporter permease [unclassified Arthrobacter]|uniref:carbohydrate ABC transporter permease n=1 Tax=unclassified Arthrobacter TaxID=235627 RepID=UPI001C857957|nr:sugar ABC transporter permease [Arthrobacter sp. MAHUQ-56]MBX7445943.1 sugar ABC transporter permease [Arthrobacter sp. MAHUQ-56]
MTSTATLHRPRRIKESRALPYLLIAPAVAIVAAVVIWPVVQTVWLSLYSGTIRNTGDFVGVENYQTLFADPDFLRALSNTGVFTVCSVAVELVLGVAVALIINRGFRGRGLVRAVTLVPWAFPTAISAIMFRLMFSDPNGLLSWVAYKLNLISQPILGSQDLMVVAAVIVDIWKTTPFVALLILAGLQTIPGDTLEAAAMDGAGAVQRFFRIVLPLLVPSILIAALFRTLDAYRVYELFWVMGNRQVDSLSTYVYEGVRVSQLQFPTGSAASVFVFITAFIIALFFVIALGARRNKA